MSIFSDILSAITTRGRRIQIKMGLAKDFNDSKLKVGEFGLVIDKDEVRIGLADGTTKEVGGLKVDDLPNASTTTKGIVQLSSSTSSTSTTLAATASAVKVAYDLANTANGKTYTLPDATSTTLGGVKVGTNISVSSGTVSVANASTSAKGVVQLNDTLTSTSTTLALTAKQGNELKKMIDNLTASSGGGITVADIPIASATQDGLMPKAMVTKLSGIATGANFVQVVDSVTSTSATQAASANSVKTVNDKLGQLGNLSLLETSQKSNLVDAINEVKQIGNSVKQNTVDALLSVDSSLPITSASTWDDIIIQIRNIKTDGSIIDLPNGYEWATDEDFSGTEDGGFWYIGTKQYVGIPSKIKGIDITSCANMFAYNTKTAIKGVASFNENITDLLNMFYENTSLTTLDLSNFNTSNVTRMSQMFMGCSSLTTLDLSNFNTSNVTRMSQMFNLCSSLTTLDLSSFNISNVTDMYAMLNGCSEITTAYARTQTDATRLNNSSDKPSTFTFVVKS